MGKWDTRAAEARKTQGFKEKFDLTKNKKTKEILGSSHKMRRNFNRKTAARTSNTSFICGVVAVVGLVIGMCYFYYATVQSLSDTGEV